MLVEMSAKVFTTLGQNNEKGGKGFYPNESFTALHFIVH